MSTMKMALAAGVAFGLAAPVAAQTVVPDFPATPIGGEFRDDVPNVVVIDAAGTISARAATRISYLNYQRLG